MPTNKNQRFRMSQFDYYLPDPALNCPACQAPLKDWKGSDGPNGYYVWQQGVRAPVEQRAEASGPLEAVHLPVAFRLHTTCCSKHFFVEAIGRAPTGTWNSTELITASNAQRDRDERMEDFKARLRWLKGSRR